jgi:hypothetical protein
MSGLQAYQSSGGDLGKTLGATLLGGGLGAAAGAAGVGAAGLTSRMAGSLATAPAVQQLLQKAVTNPAGLSALEKAVITTANIAKPAAPIVGLAAGLGTESLLSGAVPGIATALAPSTPGLAKTVGTAQYATQGGASGNWNPPIAPGMTDLYGPEGLPSVVNPVGPAAGQVARGIMEAKGQLEQMKILDPYALDMINKAKLADLYMQGSGSQLRTQLAQGAQAMNQAQVGAQALAQQSNRGVIEAATTRGGYV